MHHYLSWSQFLTSGDGNTRALVPTFIAIRLRHGDIVESSLIETFKMASVLVKNTQDTRVNTTGWYTKTPGSHT